MQRTAKRGIAILAAVLCTACALERAQVAHVAQAKMIGMGEESVLQCMGAPSQRTQVGRTEVWTYPSGNGATTVVGTQTASISAAANTLSGVGTSVATASSRYCVVSVVMENGTVARVNYGGPTGGIITEGEQCAFAVRNCVQ